MVNGDGLLVLNIFLAGRCRLVYCPRVNGRNAPAISNNFTCGVQWLAIGRPAVALARAETRIAPWRQSLQQEIILMAQPTSSSAAATTGAGRIRIGGGWRLPATKPTR